MHASYEVMATQSNRTSRCTYSLVCLPCVANVLVQIKQTLIGTGMFSDTVPCHLASGLGAGFFAVCIGSPVDVVKSRMMGMLSVHAC